HCPRDDLHRLIGRTVVEYDDLQVGVVDRQDADKALTQVLLFVAGGYEETDLDPSSRCRRRLEPVGEQEIHERDREHDHEEGDRGRGNEDHRGTEVVCETPGRCTSPHRPGAASPFFATKSRIPSSSASTARSSSDTLA